MLSGDNSILQKATDSKEKTDEAQIKEEIGLAWNGVQTEGIVNNWEISKKSEELQKDLQKEDSSASAIVSENNIEVIYKGYETTINDKTGTIINFAKAKIIIKLVRTGTTVTQAEVLDSIPSGFYHIGGSINEGLVISDVENDSMTPAESTGNQFVFVPVEKNQAIKLEVTSEEDIQSIVLYNPLEKKLVDLTNQGKNYSITINAINDDGETSNPNIINGQYKVEVTTASGTKIRKLSVRSLYAEDALNDVMDDDEFFNEVLNVWDSRTGNTGDKATIYQRLGKADDEAFKTFARNSSYLSGYDAVIKNIEQTENYVKSINTNGGFFIGRYEAIKNGDKAESKKSIIDGTTSSASSLADGMVWNYISKTDALAKAKEFNSKSSLLTGAAWDRTLDWLVETKNKSLYQIAFNSSNWGNYTDDIFSTETNLIKTGKYQQTKSNNIYDLAGNLYEWTSETRRR